MNTPCPYDTNRDGDCGRPACPFCGPTLSRRADRVHRQADTRHGPLVTIPGVLVTIQPDGRVMVESPPAK